MSKRKSNTQTSDEEFLKNKKVKLNETIITKQKKDNPEIVVKCSSKSMILKKKKKKKK